MADLAKVGDLMLLSVENVSALYVEMTSTLLMPYSTVRSSESALEYSRLEAPPHPYPAKMFTAGTSLGS